MSGIMALLSLLLLLSSSIQFWCLTEGRPLKPQEAVTKFGVQGREETAAAVGAAMIGSRPPRCEGRCLNCGQCEAVQVPTIPQEKTWAARPYSAAVAERSDDSTIYKPLSWKCKCGNVILDP